MQNYDNVIQGLREYNDSTVRRLQVNALPLLHSGLGHTCLAIHKALVEGKSLVMPIVGGNHYRTMLLHGPSQTIYWHDPYGSGHIHQPIHHLLEEVFSTWRIVNIPHVLQQDNCNCGFVCVFIAERFYEWVHGMYGHLSYEDVIFKFARLTNGRGLGQVLYSKHACFLGNTAKRERPCA